MTKKTKKETAVKEPGKSKWTRDEFDMLVNRLINSKLKAFEAELVAAKCIQPRPE